MTEKRNAEAIVRKIRRKTRWQYSTEEKICKPLEGLIGDHSIEEFCRHEGINQNL